MALCACVATALVVAAAAAASAALPSARGADRLQCACSSTHYGDVSFAVTCARNSSGHWHSGGVRGVNKYVEQSTTSCERGPAPPPTDGYRLVKGKGYYKFHARQATWEDALRTCASEGANLALPFWEDEAAILSKIFQEFPKLHEEDWLNNQAWIGASDLKDEGKFVSLTGRRLEEGYVRWSEGEPNNEGDDEHCVAIDRQRLYNDEPCDTRLAFFCERRLTPAQIRST